MNIRKYQAFVKTAEYASFTKAAKDLRCTQSGVSRMISDLENYAKFLRYAASKYRAAQVNAVNRANSLPRW